MTTRLRICFITPEYALTPPYGGIATYTRDAARWLVSHGHEAHVVLVSRPGPWRTQDDEGVQVHTVPPVRIRPRRVLNWLGALPGCRFLKEAYAGWGLVENSVGAWRMVARLERDRPFDVIEVADAHGLGFCGLCLARKKRVLVRGHGILHMDLSHTTWQGSAFQHFLERQCARRARLVLCASEYLARCYVDELYTLSVRVNVLPTGIAGRVAQADFRVQSRMPADGFVVLYVGRIECGKGSDLLFRALAIARGRCDDLRAVMLGSVSSDLQVQYDEFMMSEGSWCWHPGPVDHETVIERMLKASVLILPSRTETLPRVLIEAQFCALPTIATRVGGIPEVIEHGVTGLLVEPEDVEGLAETIVALRRDPQRCAEMGRKARECALERFSIDRVMEQQVEVYRAVAEGALPRAILRG